MGDPSDVRLQARLVASGADAFVDRSIEEAALLDTLRLVARGHIVFLPEARPRPATSQPMSELDESEVELLHSAARGLTLREIAERHLMSLATVKRRFRVIQVKLGVRNRVEAAFYVLSVPPIDPRIDGSGRSPSGSVRAHAL
jgi:DNA-binding NarL/FixJ family response regulator